METPQGSTRSAARVFPTEQGELPGESAAEEEAFIDSLRRFHGSGFRIPTVASAPLQVPGLYREVCKRGGYELVVAEKKMGEVARVLGITERHSSPSHIVKHHYERLLLAYEERFFKGRAGASVPSGSRSRSLSRAESLHDGGSSSPLPQRTPVHEKPPLSWTPSLAARVLVPAEAAPSPRYETPAAPVHHEAPTATSTDHNDDAFDDGGGGGGGPPLAPKRRRVLTDIPVPPAPLLNDQQRRQAQIQEMESIKANLKPYPGPMLVVDGLPESLGQVVSCLQSRVPEAVAWALNVLGVASKQHSSELRVQKGDRVLEQLAELMEEGIMEVPPTKRPLAQEEQWVELPEAKGKAPTEGLATNETELLEEDDEAAAGGPVPWWEAEEGLFAEDDASADAELWAICSSNILSNLSVSEANQPALATERFVLVYLKCLEHHLDNTTDGTAELAHNCLGVLKRSSSHISLADLKAEDAATLLGTVIACVADLGSVSRLRSQAASALGSLAGNEANKGVVGLCVGSGGAAVVEPLVALAEAPWTVYAAEIKDGRDEEGPGAAEAHITYLSESSMEVCGYRLWAQAQLAAMCALAGLCSSGKAAAEAVGLTPRAVPCLVNVLLCRRPAFTAGLGVQSGHLGTSHMFPTVMNSFRSLASRIRMEASMALATLAGLSEVPKALSAAEGELAEAAMTPGSDELLAQVLAILSRGC